MSKLATWQTPFILGPSDRIVFDAAGPFLDLDPEPGRCAMPGPTSTGTRSEIIDEHLALSTKANVADEYKNIFLNPRTAPALRLVGSMAL